MNDDALLSRSDPALPGLLVCLDRSLLAERLPPGVEGDVAVTYVRYKRGTSVLVSFCVTGRSGVSWWSARAASPDLPGSEGKLEKLGPVGPDLVVLAPLESDPDLPLLRTLAKRPGSLADRLHLPDPVVSTLRYKPGRRWVARVTSPEGDLALKAYASADTPPLVSRPDRLPGALRVVRASSSRAFLAFPWTPGTHPSPGDVAVLGPLLADLHAAPLPLSPALLPDRDVACAAVVDLLPDLAPSLERLRGALEHLPVSGPPCTLHGDLSLDQVLLTRSGPVLLDLDRSGAGEPAADVARLLAALEVESLAGTGALLPAPVRSEVRALLLDAYRSAGGRDLSSALPAWEALQLLSAMVEPFRARSSSWTTDARLLLQAAERAL